MNNVEQQQQELQQIGEDLVTTAARLQRIAESLTVIPDPEPEPEPEKTGLVAHWNWPDKTDTVGGLSLNAAGIIDSDKSLQSASITVAVWATPIKVSGRWGWLFALGDNLGLYVMPDNTKAVFYWRRQGGWEGPRSQINTVKLGERVFIVGTLDSATAISRLYIDGQLKTTMKSVRPIVYETGDEITIGSMQGSRKFAGDIDSVSVYDRALTADEVQELYTAGKKPEATDPDPDPVGGVFNFPQSIIDHAASLKTPEENPDWRIVGGNLYARLPPTIQVLCTVAKLKPSAKSSDGKLIAARAASQLRGAISPGKNHIYRGGHNSWSELHIPISLAIAKQTPVIWNRLSNKDRARADLIMEHCLYVGAIFCNTNDRPTLGKSERGRSLVFVDMYGLNSGSQPNQSAPYHGFLIGALSYWGDEVNSILASFNNDDFQKRLNAEGFSRIASHYARESIRQLFEGHDIPYARVDPQGIRKPLNYINTNHLKGTTPGLEHTYHGNYTPLPATMANVFIRWGDFFCGAIPKHNVGPSRDFDCNGMSFGTADGKPLPYEGTGLTGMPYELNARSGNPDNRPTRSAFHYASAGINQWCFMFAAVAVLDGFDFSDPIHAASRDQGKRAIEIFQHIGEVKWVSNSGVKKEICTSNHDDAYSMYNCMPWGYALVDTFS